jgi:hypothetical protein
MARWEYSEFATGSFVSKGSPSSHWQTWRGPSGEAREMSGSPLAILTQLGRDGWEVVAKTISGSDFGGSTVYLLKRPIGA